MRTAPLRIASLAWLLCLTAGCTPQTVVTNSVPAAGTPARGITVSGFGKANGKPNVARMTVGVEARAATAAEAIAEVNARMGQVIESVKQAGVAAADVRTATLSLHFERVDEPPRPVDAPAVLAPAASAKPRPAPTTPPAGGAPPARLPQGFYNASNTVELTIRKLEATGNIVGAATSAGANQVHGIRFELDDPSSLQADARKKAMADARQRAERLAQLAGLRLGPAVSITEADHGGSGPAPAYAMMRSDSASPVERGELTVTTTVQVVYALAE